MKIQNFIMKIALLVSLFSFTCLRAQDAFVGEIRIVGFNFEPKGWAYCDGRLLPISQNTALFSLLGTTYGGDGKTTFALPDLRGKAPVQVGQTNGLTPVALGEMKGSNTVVLTAQNLPNHSHIINATTTDGNTADPTGNVLGNTKTLDKEYSNAVPNTTMNPFMLQPTGQNAPFTNMQPYLSTNYIICLQGIFPPRG